MIFIEIYYKTYDIELLAIVELLVKAWKYYLKGCKHKVVILTNQKIYKNINYKNPKNFKN